MTTATPMTVAGDPFDFAPLRSSPSIGGSSASGVGSPGVKRKRNILKLGNKIDAWWTAVRTSFNGAEEERHRHRRTSADQPTGTTLSVMPTIEPLASRTSSQFARPTSPSTPTLRNIASAQDLSTRPSKSAPLPPNPYNNVVPTGALAPAARFDSGRGLKPPLEKARTTSSGSGEGEDSDGAATSKTWRNPHLSLNLGPAFSNILQPKVSPRSSPSPRSSAPSPLKTGSTPPVSPHESSSKGSAPIAVPIAPAVPASTSESPSLHSAYSPMWDKTPGLVPNSMHFPLRDKERRSSHSTRPLPTTMEKGKMPSSFSMQTVRQQIRQRLASAKENCDKELGRIVGGISAYVETELHKDISSPLPPDAFDHNRFGELVADETMAGYSSEQEQEYEDSGSEALAGVDVEGLEEAAYTDSDGNGTSMPPSRLKTPAVSTTPGARRRSFDPTRPRSDSPRRASLQKRARRLTSVPRNSDRRPSNPGSNTSSRSNSLSRSRSPMPPGLRHASHGSRSPGLASNATFARSDPDLAQSAFIVLLQEITSVASEILDTTISKLTAKPGVCAEYIAKVQQIGEAWNDNPELPCRGWYVQLLLAVAGLSRVVEWWEAEKGFWTFDDAAEIDSEPILFVSKPNAEEDSPVVRGRGESVSSVPSTSALGPPAPKWSPLGISLGDENDAMEVLAEERTRQESVAAGESEVKQRADDLRQAVEAIRSQTLLMELSLDGQLLQYLSSAWQDLVGCVSLPPFSLSASRSLPFFSVADSTLTNASTCPSPTSSTPTTPPSLPRRLANSRQTTRTPSRSASASASAPLQRRRKETRYRRTCTRRWRARACSCSTA